MIFPSYNGQGIVNVPVTISKILGGQPPSNHPVLSRNSFPDELYDAAKVVLLVIDSFSYDLLMEALKLRGSLFKVAGESYVSFLTSVFPSTTASAIPTLSTGRTPAEHGMLGYKLYLREYGGVVNMVRLTPAFSDRCESIVDEDFDAKGFIGVDTIYEKLADVGVDTYVLLNNRYKGSGLSHLVNIGAGEVEGYLTLADMFVRMRKALTRSTGKTYVYAYWEGLDTVSHKRTPGSDEAMAELETLFYSLRLGLLSRLEDKVLSKTVVIITGDHGQSFVKKENLIIANEDRRLMDLLSVPPTGESRVSYLYTDDPEGVARHIKDRYGDPYLVLRSSEAVRMGLFGSGEYHREFLHRIGKLVVLPAPGYGMIYQYKRKELEEDVRGGHGGLSSSEQLVGLIVGRASVMKGKL